MAEAPVYPVPTPPPRAPLPSHGNVVTPVAPAVRQGLFRAAVVAPPPQTLSPPFHRTIFTDAPSGTITLSGTIVEQKTYTDARSGTITLSGTNVDAKTVVDTATGTITLSGSIVDVHLLKNIETPSGTITLSGTIVQSMTRNEGVKTGTITLSGSIIESDFLFYPPFLLYPHRGQDRLDNIEEWLFENTLFINFTKTGYDRITAIERWLQAHPVNGQTFLTYEKKGNDRIATIERYLLDVTNSTDLGAPSHG